MRGTLIVTAFMNMFYHLIIDQWESSWSIQKVFPAKGISTSALSDNTALCVGIRLLPFSVSLLFLSSLFLFRNGNVFLWGHCNSQFLFQRGVWQGEKLRLCRIANLEISLIKSVRRSVVLIQITRFALAKQHALNHHFKVLYFALKWEMRMILSLLF